MYFLSDRDIFEMQMPDDQHCFHLCNIFDNIAKGSFGTERYFGPTRWQGSRGRCICRGIPSQSEIPCGHAAIMTLAQLTYSYGFRL